MSQVAPPTELGASKLHADDQLPIDGLSYVVGSRAQPLLQLTVSELLAHTVKACGPRSAFIFSEQGVRWTWSEFQEQVDAMASGAWGQGGHLVTQPQ